MRGLVRFLGQVLAWLVLVAALATVSVAVVVPRLGGATPYTVLTGSMRPGMPPGTLVVVRPVEASTLRVGDVITYQLRSGEPEVVTHRIVAVGVNGQGKTVFRTQGDDNPDPDPAWVLPIQVVGERWYAVPRLGYLSNAFTTAQREAGVQVVAGLLLAYAALMALRVTVGWFRRGRSGAPAPVLVAAASPRLPEPLPSHRSGAADKPDQPEQPGCRTTEPHPTPRARAGRHAAAR
ncbi:signal peptidase I [Nocardioides sp. GY 10127]|uniref:signal peptidase I n=1 Tax=Nocardioides sp. GY 10127 TaxID=2569762 RepID=UPI0010A7B9B3|nr:signal peptidase I [Nocardioides sp. GY 10127]TIC85743.1 signal peptidase I [Nocardioides sp. GY 10127]